jgi:transcription factor IIIB subunit 2
MKRDWMVEGRQPAGLVGACIIIAARQNNYRRTVREVVYVVKVCDNTIFQRLLEFKRTQAASLTIDQFRKIGHRLKVKAEPPAIYTRREREERMEERKKRKHSEMSRETIEIPDEDTQAGAAQTPPPTQRSSRSSSSPAVQSDSQPLRRDPDGFLIPNPPIDRALLEATNLAHQELLASENADNTPKQPIEKRRKKANKPPIEVPEEDLEIEGDLEDEIQHILSEQEIDDAASSARAEALATRLRGPPTVPIAEDVDEHEFDDDPEVANAVCTPAEVELRERIWVTENEAWLRERQEKMLQKALEQASGGPKKKQQRRKHSQMGDGSVLGGSPAASPAEAVEKMLGKRATKGFSKFINYENLNQLYPKGDARVDSVEASGDTTPQAGGAASPSVWAQQSPRAAAEAVEVEEEEEEEDEEEEDEDEVDAEAEIFDQFEHEEYYDDDE